MVTLFQYQLKGLITRTALVIVRIQYDKVLPSIKLTDWNLEFVFLIVNVFILFQDEYFNTV